MNIYIVQPKNYIFDYDTYDSFVCIAESEDEAKLLHPGKYFATKYIDIGKLELAKDPNTKSFDPYYSSDWQYLPNELDAKLIGIAIETETLSKVICSSYNAG